MKQTQTELTPEQKVFLDKYTKGSWELNSKTGLVDVKGSFDCSDQGLTSFEGIRFGKVGGSFYCSGNKLTTLEGAPLEVGKDFGCSRNALTTLKGAPQEVGGSFGCTMNPKLKSLDGRPKKVGGSFLSDIKESHVKMFEQFINDELNEKGSKIDPKELRLTKTISIWGNPEKFLAAEFGKDLGLPKYPKTGPITWKDEEIGFVSNWSGTVFTDMKWVEDNLDSLNKVVDKTGFWYS
jgi:hypothetical protein